MFIWIVGNRPRDMLYGFPAIDGPQSGVKIATEQYEATVDPDAVMRDISDSEVANMYSEYIQPRFPDMSGQFLRAATCLYTVTPDAKFIVDTFRDCENVIVRFRVLGSWIQTFDGNRRSAGIMGVEAAFGNRSVTVQVGPVLGMKARGFRAGS